MPDAALSDMSLRADVVLQIEALSVAYATRAGWLQALDGVSLSIPPGGVLGLVGESGSGKSTVVLALLGLLGPSARVEARRLAFDGPDLLLLDEPTTALDVTIEAQILSLLDELRTRRNLAMLLVSHNLGIVDRLCDTVSVLYAGRVAESGTTHAVLHHPRHPYTKGLLAALPRPDRPHAGRLAPIQGNLPDLCAPEPGCNFRPRCAFAAAGCEMPQVPSNESHSVSCHRVEAIADLPWPAEAAPAAVTPVAAPLPLLQAERLHIRFDPGGWLQRLLGETSGVLAVDRVSLAIRTGEVLGLVGQSGF